MQATGSKSVGISNIQSSSYLTFDSKDNGTLNVQSANAPAIGGYQYAYNITFNGGNIVVNGGSVICQNTALGSSYGGNRFYYIAADITINGGTVTAPVIGGSTNEDRTGTKVTINGGTVKGEVQAPDPVVNQGDEQLQQIAVNGMKLPATITVNGQQSTVTANHPDDETLYLYVPKSGATVIIKDQEETYPLTGTYLPDKDTIYFENQWLTSLQVQDTEYRSPMSVTLPVAIFGQASVLYSTSIDGNYTATVPTAPGTYYAKAVIQNGSYYADLESEPVSFVIRQALPDLSRLWVNTVYDSLSVDSVRIFAPFADGTFTLQADTLQYGTNTYTFTPYDSGYQTVNGEIEITIKDTTDPIISVAGNTADYLQQDTVYITANAGVSGVARVQVSYNGGDYTPVQGATYTVTQNGTYTFMVTNGEGKTQITSITYTNIDNSTPVLTIDTGDYTPGSWVNCGDEVVILAGDRVHL